MADKELFHLGFLGQEFILWLFQRSYDDPDFELENFGVENVVVILEEQVTLDSITGDGYTETIKSHELVEQEDVRSSIRQGRIPSAVKVRVIRGELEWTFFLKSSPLSFKSIKLPITADSEKDEVIHTRLILVEELNGIVEALFRLFLLEREKDSFLKDVKAFIGMEKNG